MQLQSTILKSSGSQYVHFHIHTIRANGISSPISENDSRAVTYPADSEQDGLSIAGVEFSGLNFDLELDDLSVVHLEFSGIDSELDGLFVPHVEFSGLNSMSSMHGTVVFKVSFKSALACLSKFLRLDLNSEYGK